MKYLVQHQRGTQGVNEQTIEATIVEKSSADEAITYVAGANAPRSTDEGYGGKWLDYWMATEATEDDIAEYGDAL